MRPSLVPMTDEQGERCACTAGKAGHPIFGGKQNGTDGLEIRQNDSVADQRDRRGCWVYWAVEWTDAGQPGARALQIGSTAN